MQLSLQLLITSMLNFNFIKQFQVKLTIDLYFSSEYLPYTNPMLLLQLHIHKFREFSFDFLGKSKGT